MKKINLILGILTISFITGCTQPQPSKSLATIYHDTNITSGMHTLRTPDLNIVNTVEIGDNMYQKNYLYIFDTRDVVLKNVNKQITYYASQKTVNNNQDESSLNSLRNMINGAVDVMTGGDSIPTSSINIDSIGRKLVSWSDKQLKAVCSFPNANYNNYSYYDKCLIDLNNTNQFTHISLYNGQELFELVKPIDYTDIQSTEYSKESFKYIVLYQGKIGNKIKISFREFLNDMARPAFTQNIEYELDDKETTLIGFKGLRIEVLKATNLDITYKVVEDYK
ncbi:hypothetical protein [Sulfurimonas sp. C5]|uniref:hypothetical protein n=1 Tax=Sulfurimonas sp. C5 TaxID=3036947 RepID=UPI002458AB4D|nr:hypothetical protein [Sulfurimonas sp. C5]MDH4943525.1 hypothetical protein [Sulfurimonas sp. C5]